MMDTILAKVILFELEQVAEFLKTDIRFVIDLIRKGKLPYVKIDGSEKIRMWDMMEYIEKNIHKYDEVKQEMQRIMNGEDNE